MTETRSPGIGMTIRRQLGLLWLRRYLLLVPLLVSIPLGIAVSYLMPRTYVATTLLLLQETGAGPLGVGRSEQPYETQDRLNGLQALLKSEHVLRAVIRDLHREQPPQTPQEWTRAIGDLQKAISLSTHSSEIIEIRLRGDRRDGLGKSLETITARLLESLLAPEDVILTAPQLIVERRREQLAALERERQALPEVEAPLDTDAQGRSARLAQLAAEHRHVGERLAALKSAGSAAPSAAPGEVERLTQARTRLQDEIDRLASARAPSDGAPGVARPPPERRAALDAQIQSARDRLREAEQRFGIQSPARKLQVLRAPEQITIIDAPKDPELPSLRPALIMAAAVLTGALLGLGLALLAILGDDRLRSAETLARITGAPLWGRLPAAG